VIVDRRHDQEAVHELIECAVRADLTCPADAWLTAMEVGRLQSDPLFTSEPDERQIAKVAQVVAQLEYLADYGAPEEPNDVNYLHHGVWEVKVARYRVGYFDTDGHGLDNPKRKINEYEEPASDDRFWFYPVLAPVLRLTHGFTKTEQKTHPREIELARKIRTEDLRHDQS